MKATAGRPQGLILHTETFEIISALGGFLKKDIAADADISAAFLANLLAHRGGATRPVADRIAAVLADRLASAGKWAPGGVFPELVGWTAPTPDRRATRS